MSKDKKNAANGYRPVLSFIVDDLHGIDISKFKFPPFKYTGGIKTPIIYGTGGESHSITSDEGPHGITYSSDKEDLSVTCIKGDTVYEKKCNYNK